MPWPIARAWQLFRSAPSDQPARQAERLVACVGVLLRTLVAFLVPDYRRGPPSAEVARALETLSHPSLGHYYRLIVELARHIGERDAPAPFLPEAHSWLFKQGGGPSVHSQRLEDLVHERNVGSAWTHASAPSTDAAEALRVLRFLEPLRAIWASAAWLTGYRPFRIVSGANRREGGQYVWRGRVQLLTGYDELRYMEPLPARTATPLADEEVYLASPAGDQAMSLEPLIKVLPDEKGQLRLYLLSIAPEMKRLDLTDEEGLTRSEGLRGLDGPSTFAAWLGERDEQHVGIGPGAEGLSCPAVFSSEGECLGGQFDVLAPLGRGGMAEVYKVRHRETGMLWALKILGRDLAHDVRSRERFRLEAQKSELASHPNVLRPSFCETLDDGRPYILMPIMDGGSLRDRILSGRQPEELVLSWACDVLDALVFLAGQSVVHRDVKPENILLDGSGRALLADFGIALDLGGDGQRLTGTLEFVGSTDYAAPEQRGRGQVTPRADVFSLARVLHELVVGRLPKSHAGEGVKGPLGKLLKEMSAEAWEKRPSALDVRTRIERLRGTKDPDHPLIAKARALEAGGDVGGAANVYVELLEAPDIDPHDAAAEEAVTRLAAIQRLDPTQVDVADALVHVYTEQRNYERVRDVLELRLSACTSRGGRVELIGRIADLEAGRLRSPERAFERLRGGVAVDPDSDDLLQRLNRVAGRLDRQAELAETLAALAAIATTCGRRADLRVRAAEVMVERSKTSPEAAMLCAHALLDEPAHAAALRTLLRLPAPRPLVEEYTEALKRAWQAQPGCHEAAERLEALYAECEAWMPLVALLEQRTAAEPDAAGQAAIETRLGAARARLPVLEAAETVLEAAETEEALEARHLREMDWESLTRLWESRLAAASTGAAREEVCARAANAFERGNQACSVAVWLARALAYRPSPGDGLERAVRRLARQESRPANNLEALLVLDDICRTQNDAGRRAQHLAVLIRSCGPGSEWYTAHRNDSTLLGRADMATEARLRDVAPSLRAGAHFAEVRRQLSQAQTAGLPGAEASARLLALLARPSAAPKPPVPPPKVEPPAKAEPTPPTAATYAALAHTHTTTQPDAAQALEAWEKVIELGGVTLDVIDGLRRVAAMRGVQRRAAASIWVRVGECELTLKRSKQATEAWQRALAADPTRRDLEPRLEALLTDREAWAELVALLVRRAKTVGPLERHPLFLRVAEVQEKYLVGPAAAFASLRSAHEAAPGNSDVLAALERLAGVTKRWGELCEEFDRALDSSIDGDQKVGVCLAYASVVHSMLGEPDRALKLLLGWCGRLATAKSAYRLHFQAGRSLAAAGRWKEAAERFARVQGRLVPEIIRLCARAHQAIAWWRAGDAERAGQAFSATSTALAALSCKEVPAEVAEAVANAGFHECEHLQAQMLGVRIWSPSTFSKRLSAKIEMVQRISGRAAAVAELDRTHWTVPAMDLLGRAYEHLVTTILHAPTPKALGDEDRTAFEMDLHAKAAELGQVAASAYRSCLEHAARVALSNPVVEHASQALGAIEARARDEATMAALVQQPTTGPLDPRVGELIAQGPARHPAWALVARRLEACVSQRRAVVGKWLAIVYRDHLGDDRRALRHIDAVLALASMDAEALEMAGRLYFVLQDWAQAGETLARLEHGHFRSMKAAKVADIRVLRGLADEHLGLPDKAKSHYEAALLVDPSHVGALRNMTRLSLERGDAKQAGTCCDALMRAPGGQTDDDYALYAHVARQRSRLPAVRQHFEALAAKQPHDVPSRQALVAICEAQQDWDAMARHGRVLLALRAGDRLELRLRLARVCFERRKTMEEGIALLRAVLDDQPGSSEAHMEVLDLAGEFGLHGTEAEALERMVQLTDTAAARATLHLHAARLFAERLGDPERAKRHARAALDEDPTDEEARTFLLELLAAKDDFDGLLSTYEHLIEELADDDTQASLRSSCCEAAALLWSEVRKEPEKAATYRHLAAELRSARSIRPAASPDRAQPLTDARLRDMKRRFEAGGSADGVWNACAALALLGKADASELAHLQMNARRSMLAPARPPPDQFWTRSLLSDGHDLALCAVFEALAPMVRSKAARIAPTEAQPSGSTILDPKAVETFTSALAHAAKVLRIGALPVVYYAKAATGLRVLRGPQPAIVIGDSVRYRLQRQDLAFVLGRLLTFFHPLHALIPMVAAKTLGELLRGALGRIDVRDDALPSGRAEKLVLDYEKLSPLPAVLDERTRVLVHESGGWDIETWVRQVEQTANHAGLFLCQSPMVAARMLNDGSAVAFTDGESTALQVQELASYAVSERYLALRAAVAAQEPRAPR